VQVLLRCGARTAPATLRPLLVRADLTGGKAVVTWSGQLSLPAGPAQLFTMSVTDGPVVSAGQLLGWTFTAGSNSLYYRASDGSSDGATLSVTWPDSPPKLSATYSLASAMNWPWSFSIGAVVEQSKKRANAAARLLKGR